MMEKQLIIAKKFEQKSIINKIECCSYLFCKKNFYLKISGKLLVFES